MKKGAKDLNSIIATNIARWDKERVVSEYMREKMSEIDPESGLTAFDQIADNIIKLAKVETKPEWTPLALSMIKKEEKKIEGNTINFFQIASEQINDNIDKLINITPTTSKKAKGIERII